MLGPVNISDVALQAGDNLSMWKGCQSGTILVTLSGQIIIIADPSVSGFEGMRGLK